MNHFPLLNDFLLILAISIPVAFLFQKFRFPSIVGYLATGMLVGPYGTRLIGDIEAVQALAEIGVVLLLFTIGLDFSLRQFLSSGKRLLFLAIAQVVATIGATAVLARVWGLPQHHSIFLGFLCSLSSTAIVLKVLADRAEIDTPQGRISTAILLFQDLCIIPMLLLTPSIATGTFDFMSVLRQLLVAALTVSGLIVTARYLVPVLLRQIVVLRSRELFLITIVVVCLGTAYASAYMGLTLAIGAFIAGLVISESDYSHQILSDILPFRDVFNALFFVSVGMLLNVRAMASSFAEVFSLAIVAFALKTAILFAVLRLSKHTLRVALITSFALAQVGEFSLLLAQEGMKYRLLSEQLYQLFLSASVLTLFFTPFAILMAGPLAAFVQQRWSGAMPVAPEDQTAGQLKDHLLIIGFGLNGKNLSRVVRDIGIPFIVIELDHSLVQKANENRIPALFGDATSQEVLLRAGAADARMVVVAISDAAATRRCVAVVRSLNNTAVILVRTRYVVEVESLLKIGANIIIPEEFETSIEIFSRVLEQYRIPDHLINQQISVIRSEGYGMLRGFSLTQERLMKISELFLKSTVEQVVVSALSPAMGRTLRELDLRRATGASIIAVIRGDEAMTNPDGNLELLENDVLVLWGAHQQLSAATKRLTE